MSRAEDAPGSKTDPLIGRVIAGNFRVERLIGAGAMGGVYQAVQLSLGKAVAIKVLHPHLMGDESLAKRFHREAKSASSLNHPNSIQIIDFGRESDGMLFIAMELLAGRDLAHVMREQSPLQLARIVRIMSQVLSALDEAHAAGIIHRDLKPGNIMIVDRRGERDFVKVCDFGIAKVQDAPRDGAPATLTMQGMVCGTPEYMAPEQARGESLDGRADLYAAAVILYQMVTGDLPFNAGSALGILTKHLTEPPEPPSRRRPDAAIDPALEALILRGLAKDREQRPATAASMRAELEALAAGLGPQSSGARVPSVAERAASARTGEGLANSASDHGRVASHDALAPTAVPSHPPASGSSGLLARPDGRSGPATNAGTEQPAPGTLTPIAGPRAERRPGATRIAVAAVALAGAATIGGLAVYRRTPSAPPATAVVAPSVPSPATQAGPEAAGARAVAGTQAAPEAAPGRASAGAQAAPELKPPQAVAETPPAAAAAPEPTPAAHAPRSRRRAAAKHGRTSAASAPAAQAAAAAPAAASAPTEQKPPTPARGAREAVAEAEKLLGEGRVAEACARGEDARRMSPELPLVYRFLGRCYNRAGKSAAANESYRKYLQLAPDAPDAAFVRGALK